MESGKDVIYVTGFGPFPPYLENASQLAVEALREFDLEQKLGVKMITDVVQVEYDSVKKYIPSRWKEIKPKLVVHVGVSHQAKTMTLEKQAFNGKYDRKDICQLTPSGEICFEGGKDILETELCLQSVKTQVDALGDKFLPCSISDDPGKYLCSFIYYCSLKEDSARSVFIHVPDIKEVPTDMVSRTLAEIISALYNQIKK